MTSRGIRPWTEGEIAQLKRMRTSGAENIAAIAERLGRTNKAIRQKLAYLELTPEMKRRRYDAEARRRQDIKGIRRSDHFTFMVQTPEEVLADRNKRLMLRPRDLSAAYFGDPLPGYSALERRA